MLRELSKNGTKI